MPNIFGYTCKLRTTTDVLGSSATLQQLQTALENSEIIGTFPFYYPTPQTVLTPSTISNNLSGKTLFNTDGLVGTTASLLDNLCEDWQQIRVLDFFKTTDTILETILEQFPNNYNFDVDTCYILESQNAYLYLRFDSNNFQVIAHYFNSEGSSSLGNMYPVMFTYGSGNYFNLRHYFVWESDGHLLAFYYGGYKQGGYSFGSSLSVTNYLYNDSRFHGFYLPFTEGYTPPSPDTDPYAPGGPSEPGGGGGTFDDTSDSNPIPSDPTISATDTGFMTAFATNLAGIQSLSASLWSDLFSAIQPGGSLEGTVEALKNIVASPYDAILGCHIIPVNVAVGASKTVKLYGVLPSSVSLPVAASQWVHKDCGTLTIQPYDGSYLDYAPYSKVTSLYLPFVGVVSVDIDIIMNTTIGVYYKIDIISGQCIAFITKNGDVYFQYQGQCAVPLPVTSVDWSTTVSAGLGIVGSIGSIAGSAVGGALGGGGAAGALAGAVKGTIGEAGSIAQNVMNSKPDIKSGSGVGGSAALMGCKNPYLIIERPRKSTPAIDDLYQNHWTGYPSNIAARLGDLSGYTEVSRVFVNRTNATADEKQEIEKLLNEGVYF